MGTNYYIVMSACPHCKHKPDNIHIGKSSSGWVFALHADENFKCLHDYIDYVEKNSLSIINEYDEPISIDELNDICLNRSSQYTFEENLEMYQKVFKKPITMDEWFNNNSAVKGPRNLMRSKIDGIHCIGHDGDIDLIRGTFS